MEMRFDKPSATLVLDVGKTNVKLLAMAKGGEILAVERLENRSIDGPPYPHLDTEKVWSWLLQAAAGFSASYEIDAIVPTTHGCTAALMGGDRLALPILDYEAEPPQETAEAFAVAAPAFAETCCPTLPGGDEPRPPAVLAAARLPTGVRPRRPRPHLPAVLVLAPVRGFGERADLDRLPRPPVESPGAALFPPWCSGRDGSGCFPHPAGARGPGADSPRDRAAHRIAGALPRPLRHPRQQRRLSLYLRGHPRPFSLVSTGTWVVMFSPRLPLDRLDEERDTLAFVDLMGRPVPAARYMGGREFEILSAGAGSRSCTEADLRRVLAGGSFLLPSFAPGGPFMGRAGTPSGPEPQTDGETIARATLYASLMTATSLGMLEADGDLVIDGGFVNNELYCRLLAALAGCESCFANHQTEGTAVGAGMLAVWEEETAAWPLNLVRVDPFDDPALGPYAGRWNTLLGESAPGR